MASEQQNRIDVSIDPTPPLPTLNPAPSLVENLQKNDRPSYTWAEALLWGEEVHDTKLEPYLHVITTRTGSEARIWTPGPNTITLPFVPSLSDRIKDPSEYIKSLSQYKKHDANPDSKRNIHGCSGDRVNPPSVHPPAKHTFADNGDKYNATLRSWVRRVLCCVFPRKISSPYVSYGGSESESPLV